MSPLGIYYAVPTSTEWRSVGRTAISFTPPTPPDPPVNRPSRSNSGWVGAGSPSLTAFTPGVYTGIDTLTLNNRSIAGDLEFGDGCSNIILNNCKVEGQIKIREVTNISIAYTDATGFVVDGPHDWTLSYVYTTGELGVDGLQVKADGGSVPTNGLVEYSYLGNPVINSTSHYDGIQCRGLNGLEIRYTYVDMGTQFSDRYNAALFLENANGGNFNVNLHDSWIRAAGYYHIKSTGSGHTFTDLTFGNKGLTSAITSSSTGYTATNCKWEDGTTAIADS